MGVAKKKQKVITFPLTVFETADTKDDLENWLLAHNPDFVKRMQNDFQGEGKEWDKPKKELGIK